MIISDKIRGHASMSNNRPAYISYNESELGQINQALITKIKAIREYYAGSNDHSVEKLHADKLLASFESALARVHHKILPKFSKGRCPNTLDLPGLVKHGLELKSESVKFMSREFVVFEAISKEIDKYVKAAVKQGGNIWEVVCAKLEANQANLFKDAAKIPSQHDEATILDTIKQIIKDRPLFRNHDLVDNDIESLKYWLFLSNNAPYEIFSLEIAHAEMFELFIAATDLMLDAPKNLRDLVGFLNPAAFNLNLYDGIILNAIEKIAEKFSVSIPKFKLEHIDDESLAYRTYQYKKCKLVGEKESTMNIDCDGHYNATYSVGLSYLLERIQAYYLAHHQNERVQQVYNTFLTKIAERCKKADVATRSDVAMMNMLHDFRQIELQYIADLAAKKQNSIEVDITNLTQLEAIQAYDAAIAVEESNYKITNALYAEEDKLARASLRNLLLKSEALTRKLNADKEAGLNTDYANQLLPKCCIINEANTNKFEIVNLYQDIRNEIRNKLKEVDFSYNRLNALQLERDKIYIKWVDEQVAKFNVTMQRVDNDLKATESELTELLNSFTKDQNVDKVMIIEALRRIKAQFNFIKNNDIEPAAKLDSSAASADAGGNLRNYLRGQIKPRVAIAEAGMQDCINNIHKIEAQQQHDAAIRKKESFAKGMQTHDLGKLKEHVTQANEAIMRMGQELEVIKEKRHAVTAEYERINAVMQMMNAKDQLSFNAREAALNATLDQISQEVAELLPEVKLPGRDILDTWLQKQISQHHANIAKYTLLQRSSSKAELEKDLKLMRAVRSCLLANSSQNKISFTALTALPELNHIGKQDRNNKNDIKDRFNWILSRLGCDDNSIAEWNEYRQNKRKEKNSAEAKYISLLAMVNNKIDSLTLNLQRLDEENTALMKLQLLNNRLQDCQSACAAVHAGMHDLNSEREHYVTADPQLAKQSSELKAELDTLSASYDQMQQNITECENEINALNARITIIEKLANLNEQINQFEQKETAVFGEEADCQMMESMIRLFNHINQINIKANADMDHLVASINERMCQALDAKYKSAIENFDSLADQLKSCKDYLDNHGMDNEYRQKAENIYKQISRVYKDLQEMLAVVSSHPALQGKVNHYVEALRAVSGDFGKHINESIATLDKELSDSINETRAAHDKIFAIIPATQEAEFYTGDDAALSEHLMTCKNLSVSLAKAQDKYLLRPVLQGMVSKISGNDYEASLQALRAQIANCQSTLQRWLLVRSINHRMNTYLENRHERHKIKDRFFKSTRQQRIQFVAEFANLMKAYVLDGNEQSLLNVLYFAGRKTASNQFKSLVNGFYVELLDMQRQGKAQDQDVDPETVLTEMDATHPDMVASLRGLYGDIDLLSTHAANLGSKHAKDAGKLKALSVNLKDELDRFVRSKPANSKDCAVLYQSFKEAFCARLDSHANIVEKHKVLWPIVVNILVGVFTVGIALGIKLIHSRKTTGKFNLFFSQSSPLQKNVDRIEKKAANIPVPAAAKEEGKANSEEDIERGTKRLRVSNSSVL